MWGCRGTTMKRALFQILATTSSLLAAAALVLLFTGVGCGDVWAAEPQSAGFLGVGVALAACGVVCLALARRSRI
jgi:hypothetical protein